MENFVHFQIKLFRRPSEISTKPPDVRCRHWSEPEDREGAAHLVPVLSRGLVGGPQSVHQGGIESVRGSLHLQRGDSGPNPTFLFENNFIVILNVDTILQITINFIVTSSAEAN